jgi:hypothetical protein
VPDLLIRIKKNKDGSASLSCIRRDGSTTWQRQDGKLGAFFPPHDLTHYAVERTLGYSNAFYGLIADGWELADFAAPAADRRGPIPREAGEVEVFVGVLDLERSLLQRFSTAEFNDQARFAADWQGSKGFVPRELTDDELSRVRAARAEVFARWAAVEPGSALELPFERGVPASD